MMLAQYPTPESSDLVSYVDDYLDCVESLPQDIQRNVSLLREIDNKYQEILKEVDEVFDKYKKEADGTQRKRLQMQLQRALINSQELGDEKIHVVTQMMEVVENRSRQIEAHSPCILDPSDSERLAEKPRHETGSSAANAVSERSSSRRPRRHRNSESRDSCYSANGANGVLDDPSEEPAAQPPREKKSKSVKKKKRSKAKPERDVSPTMEFSIDPNEPTYCLCEQVSYGEMIGCDNEQCPIEWFHFSCVGLTYKPKGKWYCPKCRGDSEKTMEKSTERVKKDRRSR
ncbi:inhibitor of growth protein 2, partial [Tachysurus ichikawai]